MMQVPLEMPAPAAVPSVQIIRAVLREYHAATHTAEVEPVLGPASLVGEIPVLMSCRPDLLTAGREVAVLTWSDVGGLVLGPYGGVPGDPPNADDADKVDGIHAANTPTASKLLAMDASAKFPAHTVAGDLAVDGDITMPLAKHYIGGGATIADDNFTSFTPSKVNGVLLISARHGLYDEPQGIVAFRVAASGTFTRKMCGWTDLDATTGALDGTTGANGHVTVSAHTDGKLYVENRFGCTITVSLTLFGY